MGIDAVEKTRTGKGVLGWGADILNRVVRRGHLNKDLKKVKEGAR